MESVISDVCTLMPSSFLLGSSSFKASAKRPLSPSRFHVLLTFSKLLISYYGLGTDEGDPGDSGEGGAAYKIDVSTPSRSTLASDCTSGCAKVFEVMLVCLAGL
jgi:hypothetical protein